TPLCYLSHLLEPPTSPTRRSSDLLAVALGEVRVSRREQCPGGVDRDEQRRARAELLDVHVPRLLARWDRAQRLPRDPRVGGHRRSEEHTSELQSPYDIVCRLLLEY